MGGMGLLGTRTVEELKARGPELIKKRQTSEWPPKDYVVEVRRGQGPGQDCYRGGRLRHLRRDTNFGAHSPTRQALLADLARWTPGAQALHIPGKTKRYRIFCILELPP